VLLSALLYIEVSIYNPYNMICVKCNSAVLEQVMLLCCVCKGRFHYSCQSVKELNYRKMSAENKGRWKCMTCKTGMIESKNTPVDIVAKQGCELPDAGTSADMRETFHRAAADASSTVGASLSLSPADLQAIGLIVKQLIHSEISPSFKQDFNEMKHSIDFISNEFDVFKNELLSHKREIELLKSEINELKIENGNLKSEISSMQEYTRRENLVVTGIAETPNESVFQIFNNISSAINSDLTSRDLSTAHRLPSRAKGNSKPIVFRFLRRQDKEAWQTNFRSAANKDNGGPGISAKSISKSLPENRVLAFQHHSPSVMTLFREVKRCAVNKGYRFVWIRDNNIMAKKDEASKTVVIIKKEDDMAKL
jgi:hypothetical protein